MRSIPHTANFSTEGKAAWIQHHNALAAEMNDPAFPSALMGPWGKLKEYAGRLALILACLRQAADPTADLQTVPIVRHDIVENALKLVHYFKSHARRAHRWIGEGKGTGGGRVVKAIVDWLRDGRMDRCTERDVTQARRWIEPADLRVCPIIHGKNPQALVGKGLAIVELSWGSSFDTNDLRRWCTNTRTGS